MNALLLWSNSHNMQLNTIVYYKKIHFLIIWFLLVMFKIIMGASYCNCYSHFISKKINVVVKQNNNLWNEFWKKSRQSQIKMTIKIGQSHLNYLYGVKSIRKSLNVWMFRETANYYCCWTQKKILYASVRAGSHKFIRLIRIASERNKNYRKWLRSVKSVTIKYF